MARVVLILATVLAFYLKLVSGQVPATSHQSYDINELDTSIVERCYYNDNHPYPRSSADAAKCELLEGTASPLEQASHHWSSAVQEHTARLQYLYAYYKATEKYDPINILRCMLTSPPHSDLHHCWNVLKRDNWDTKGAIQFLTKREIKAYTHQDKFAEFIKTSLNTSFIEHCYFDQNDWNQTSQSESTEYYFCSFFSDPSISLADQGHSLLHLLLLDHRTNEAHDSQRVFECFLGISSPTYSKCWQVSDRRLLGLNPVNTEPANRREQNAQQLLIKFENLQDKLDLKLIDYCYYNGSLWRHNTSIVEHHFCAYITGEERLESNLDLPASIKWAKEIYNDYRLTEPSDLLRLLKCYLTEKGIGAMDYSIHRKCQTGNNRGPIRLEHLNQYFEFLSKAYSKMEVCWTVIQSEKYAHWEKATGCDLESLLEIREGHFHCGKLHRSKVQTTWEPCEKIRKPLTAAPTEIGALLRYIGWHNRSSAWLTEDLAKVVDPNSFEVSHAIDSCLFNDGWLGQSDHFCQRMANRDGSHPAKNGLDAYLQRRWQERTKFLHVHDCVREHPHDMVKKQAFCADALDIWHSGTKNIDHKHAHEVQKVFVVASSEDDDK